MPFYSKLKCYFDFTSIIKSIWLTGYILITWEDWQSLRVQFYPSGEYE